MPSFPPLFRGAVVAPGVDPFASAVQAARDGVDPGLILFQIGDEQLVAALILAPEAPLEDAMAMVFAAAIGLSDALGALGPSEVAVQFDWPGTIRINGARCGRFRASAATRNPAQEPDWLVVGFEINFAVPMKGEPGDAPDNTTLYEEGCGDITPVQLLESWSRHTLVWINRWLDEGMPPLHSDWSGRAWGIGEERDVPFGPTSRGKFVGLDEAGGMLLKAPDGMHLLPLSLMLEDI